MDIRTNVVHSCKILVIITEDAATSHSVETIQHLAHAYEVAREHYHEPTLKFDLEKLVALDFCRITELPEDFCCETIITPRHDWFSQPETFIESNSTSEYPENIFYPRLGIAWFWQSANIIGNYRDCWAYFLNV